MAMLKGRKRKVVVQHCGESARVGTVEGKVPAIVGG